MAVPLPKISAPGSSESSQARIAARRSATVPSKLQTNPIAKKPVEIGDSRGVETIYMHPSARVVSFNTAHVSTNRRSSDGASAVSWRTSTERTVATGPLEVYRVPGSVAFLYSGALLHALMPRANCWCVDDVSTFILRVSIDTYYRIELPGTTEDDLARVEEFKSTLQKVLFYERSPCPFRRGSEPELPETPRPLSRRLSKMATEPAKKWRLDGVWRPEDAEDWEPQYSRASVLSRTEQMVARGDVSPLARKTKAYEFHEPDESVTENSDQDTPISRRPSTLAGMRSITAPPKLTLVASPPSKGSSASYKPPLGERIDEQQSQDGQEEGETDGDEKDVEARSVSPSPGPTGGAEKLVDTRTDSVSIDNTGDATIRGMSVELQQAQEDALVDAEAPPSAVSNHVDGLLSEDDVVESRIWGGISTPSLSSDSEDHSWGEVTTPPEMLRARKFAKTSAVASLSRVSSDARIRRVASADSQMSFADNINIVRKTCNLVLGPPAHVVAVMLKIAARITNGSFNFIMRSPLDSPHTVPGSWYIGDEEDDWDLDDYGFPTGRLVSRQHENEK